MDDKKPRHGFGAIMTPLSLLKGLGDIISKIPLIVWAILISLAVAWAGRGYVDSSKQAMRDSTAVHHEIIRYVPTTVYLPSPNPPKLIHGTPIHDTVIVVKRDTIIAYDTIRTSPDNFQATIDDSVQHTTVLVFSQLQSIYPLISYKPQKVQVPMVTVTLPPKEIPWYQTGTMKVVYGILGTGCIYESNNVKAENRIYWRLIGVGVLTVGFAL
jgi:hypothetical protein